MKQTVEKSVGEAVWDRAEDVGQEVQNRKCQAEQLNLRPLSCGNDAKRFVMMLSYHRHVVNGNGNERFGHCFSIVQNCSGIQAQAQ